MIEFFFIAPFAAGFILCRITAGNRLSHRGSGRIHYSRPNNRYRRYF